MLNIYDDYAEIGDYAEIADSAKIGYRAKIGDNVKLGNNAKIGDNATIGDNVRIADWAKIGDGARILDCARIGDGAEIGDGARIGSKFRCEDLNVIDFFTMSNVDGTGRRIHIYVHTKGVTVRAGCFIGTLDDFCNKAEDEGKHLYAVTVRAAAKAFAAEIHRQGKTGGWDK